MQIPVQLITPSHTMKAVDTQALIDSGASISCIDGGLSENTNSLLNVWKLWFKPGTWTTPSTQKE